MRTTLINAGKIVGVLLVGAGLLIGTVLTTDWPDVARASMERGSGCPHAADHGLTLRIGPARIVVIR